ncbi:MAG: D-alanine--D-alanine ligase [Desulfobacterales bacterium]|jgi:D-alanine-D-alanine ligase
MKKNTIALLSGGISSEREVSLNSGEQVYQALDKTRYDIIRYDPQTDLPKLVADADKIDAALVILHGPFGEDGTIQGMLDLLDIPYQGAGVMSSAVAMNKLVAKRLYEHAGLKIPPYCMVRRGPIPELGGCVQHLGLPIVVKPVEGGSSIGMSIAASEKELRDAVEEAFKYDELVLLEKYLEGTEVTGGVLGNDDPEALPLIEIIPGEGHTFFNYEAKYKAGETTEICPARISVSLTDRAQACAIQAHEALFCRGYSRTDMIIHDDDIYVLETNTIPGMTATSLFPQAAAKAGLDFTRLLDRLIALSLEGRSRRRAAAGS